MKSLALSILSTLALALPAHATSHYDYNVFLADCDDAGCEGITYFVGIDEVAVEEYELTIVINADGYTGSDSGIVQIGGLFIKDWDEIDLLMAPDASWSDPVRSPISANSTCSKSSNGNQDKICSFGYTEITDGGDYTWKFSVLGGEVLDEIEMHFGGQFGDFLGRQPGQVISAAVPEPSAALAFATGLAVTVSAIRRRRLG